MFLRDKDWAQVVKTNHFPLHYFTLGPESESVSAQAKAISEVIKVKFQQRYQNSHRIVVSGIVGYRVKC